MPYMSLYIRHVGNCVGKACGIADECYDLQLTVNSRHMTLIAKFGTRRPVNPRGSDITTYRFEAEVGGGDTGEIYYATEFSRSCNK